MDCDVRIEYGERFARERGTCPSWPGCSSFCHHSRRIPYLFRLICYHGEVPEGTATAHRVVGRCGLDAALALAMTPSSAASSPGGRALSVSRINGIYGASRVVARNWAGPAVRTRRWQHPASSRNPDDGVSFLLSPFLISSFFLCGGRGVENEASGMTRRESEASRGNYNPADWRGQRFPCLLCVFFPLGKKRRRARGRAREGGSSTPPARPFARHGLPTLNPDTMHQSLTHSFTQTPTVDWKGCHPDHGKARGQEGRHRQELRRWTRLPHIRARAGMRSLQGAPPRHEEADQGEAGAQVEPEDVHQGGQLPAHDADQVHPGRRPEERHHQRLA